MKSFLFFAASLFFSVNANAQKTIPIEKAAYAVITVGEKPDFMAVYHDEAWVVDDHHDRIIKLAADGRHVLSTTRIPAACTAPVIGFGSVWIMSCTEKKLYRVDHASGKVVTTIATGMADTNGEMSLAIADGSVWLLSDSAGTLARIDPRANSIQKKISVLPHSFCAAAGQGAVWITNYANNSVQRIDPHTNTVTHTIPVGANPRFLSVGESGIFTLNQGTGTVSRIDPVRKQQTAEVNVYAKGSGGDITVDGDKIWVVSTNPARPVQIIDAKTNRVSVIYAQTAPRGKPLKVDGAARVSEKYVWVSGYHSKTVWVFKR